MLRSKEVLWVGFPLGIEEYFVEDGVREENDSSVFAAAPPRSKAIEAFSVFVIENVVLVSIIAYCSSCLQLNVEGWSHYVFERDLNLSSRCTVDAEEYWSVEPGTNFASKFNKRYLVDGIV